MAVANTLAYYDRTITAEKIIVQAPGVIPTTLREGSQPVAVVQCETIPTHDPEFGGLNPAVAEIGREKI